MPFSSATVKQGPAGGPLAGGITTLAIFAAVLSGCGGGGETFPVSEAKVAGLRATAASPVRLEGCVVDELHIPKTGASLRALAADGRLIVSATSDSEGMFRLQLPPRQTVTIEIARPGAESMVVKTGSSNLSISACLRDSES